MIDAGVRVAIATDLNPGSSVFNNQPYMWNLAMVYAKMTVEEGFKGVTRNAALSLGRDNVGIIDQDAQADLLVWNGLDSITQIPYYHYESIQNLTHRFKAGKLLKNK